MEQCWDNVGTKLGQCKDNVVTNNIGTIFGQFLEQFWNSNGTILGQFWNSNGTILGQLLPYHFFAFPPPSIPIEVDTGWGTEKSFFVAVGFLSHFGVKHYYDHVATFPKVLFHCVSC